MGEFATESRGGEEFERLHALTLPPVMSRADSGSAGLRLQPRADSLAFSFSENSPPKFNRAAAFWWLYGTDARPPSFPQRFQWEEGTN